MKKRIVVLCLLGVILLSGCATNNTNPQVVIFKNQTLLNSSQACVTVVYSKDRRLEDKYTDIYVKADKNNLNLKIGDELDILKEITIKNQGEWYSLTNLFNEHKPLFTFKNSKTTTYIIQSEKSAKLTFKALGGDVIYHIDSGENELVNRFPVSKEINVTLY